MCRAAGALPMEPPIFWASPSSLPAGKATHKHTVVPTSVPAVAAETWGRAQPYGRSAELSPTSPRHGGKSPSALEKSSEQ